MENKTSRSELKRRAQRIEDLAQELVKLSVKNITNLPCPEYLVPEILAAQKIKGGAKKRLIKYIAKELRNIETDPILDFLEEKRGSKLKENRDFHELEHLRDTILNETIAAFDEARSQNESLSPKWESPSLASLRETFPDLDLLSIQQLAFRFARTRKITLNREIFRMLKGAFEKAKFGI
ncbi:MAG: DUF615 domain-containing protein [Proteobacteria bacterium]|nr:DUF615 domain-containing protein [Pseudomonadota bacterium]MBU1709925.1 DUF615 domain-containing protein [Pseudomonadota bacterium]